MKKEVIEEVEHSLSWGSWGTHDAVSVDQLKSDIKQLEKLGVTHVVIEPWVEYDCPALDITPIIKREETDEEYKYRVELESRLNREKEAEKIALLRELYAKYGDKL